MVKHVKFEEIISRTTVYGIIWSGTYKSKKCIIKMIALSSGETNKEYFEDNDKIPFLHKEFAEKKHMSLDNFVHEAKSYKNLSDLDLSPHLYDCGIIKKYPVHYGYIIAERLDCSVKDIVIKRELTEKEQETISEAIKRMHSKGIAHGDMKPSNIGVYLNENGSFDKCYFFDCQKIKYSTNFTEEEFMSYVRKDFNKYIKHYEKNRKEGEYPELVHHHMNHNKDSKESDKEDQHKHHGHLHNSDNSEDSHSPDKHHKHSEHHKHHKE